MLDRRSDIILAALVALFSGLTLFVWIPNDSDTAMIETFRWQTFIGDAFLPSVAAGGMLIAAVVQLIVSLRRKPSSATATIFDSTTAAFFVAFVPLMALSLLLMFWTGPALWELFGDGNRTYRQMRGTFPWKYLGFVLGGIALVWGSTSLVESRIKARRLLLAALFTGFLILIFDVPFTTLLLPPNGDW